MRAPRPPPASPTARRRAGGGPSAEGGFVSVQVLLVGILLAGISFAFLQQGLGEARSVNQFESHTIALELAETGLVRAEMELRSQIDADGGGLGTVQGSWRDGDSGGQTFDVEAAPGDDDLWVLRATGSHRLTVRRVEVGLRVRKPYVFRHALVGLELLKLEGAFSTDAYDSRAGSYASQAVNGDANGAWAEAVGHVASNDRILLYSSARVRGDARPGPDETVTLVGTGCVVTGDTSALEEPLAVPAPPSEDFEEAYARNDDARDVVPGSGVSWDAVGKDLAVNGGLVRLAGGTYFFHDLVVEGSGVLQVDGPSTVYVTGALRFESSAQILHSGPPAALRFVAHPYALTPGYAPPTDPIRFASPLTAALTLYAPGRDVDLTAAVDVAGAIVGRHVLAGSTGRVHYDRALGEAPENAAARTRRLWWRDLSPAGR